MRIQFAKKKENRLLSIEIKFVRRMEDLLASSCDRRQSDIALKIVYHSELITIVCPKSDSTELTGCLRIEGLTSSKRVI